ncbi:hypothetical protein [uncultured Methanobrevibacter sp.]|uniref:hypothetical protein n=1 Tax=uncultured Methanobrevibacter sp. TaxID=253161 RepID=UPI0025D45739|nr:hypothetical protein [uncultured Methanobrevibacter sp.]
MSEKEQLTVGELIKELEKLPKHLKVEVAVVYDNCRHIQPLYKVFNSASADIDWIILMGDVE